MVPYYGDFAEDDTVYIRFNTFDSNDPSASVTVTTLIDSDVKVYKDAGVTEIATDGATVTINFDSRTGAHIIAIDTNAHADYTTGSEYGVMIEGATVDAGNITAWVGTFSIERAGGVLALIKAGNLSANVAQWNGSNVATPATAGVPSVDTVYISGDQSAANNCESFFDNTGYTGANNVIGTVTAVTTVNGLAADVITSASIATNATTEIGQAVWDLDCTALQTTGSFGAAIGDPGASTKSLWQAIVGDATGASVTADVATLTTTVGTAGDGLTAINLPNQTMDITGNITGNLSGSVGSVTGLTESGIVDAVWNEDLSPAHDTAGSAGKALQDAGAAGDPWSTALPGAYGAGTAGEILGDWKDTGRLDAILDATATAASISALNDVAATDIVSGGAITTSAGAVSNVTTVATTTTNTDMVTEPPTAATISAAVWNEDATGHQTAGTFGEALGDPLATGNSVRDLISGLNDVAATDIVSSGAITTSGGAVSNVTLVATTTTNTDMVAEAPAASVIADAVWDETMAGHVTADTAGEVMNDWQEGGRLDLLLDDVPNTSEFDARTLVAASYYSPSADLVLVDGMPEINTAYSDIPFLWVDSSNVPVTGATGTSVTRSIDGAAFGSATGTLAEIGNGIYQFDASQADMNGAQITFRFVATGGTPGAPDDAFLTIFTRSSV